jgi:polyisoprenoid-binding protein YceI
MLTFKAQSATSPAPEQAALQLPSWTFDPDRTEANFRARLMGTMWLNGRFKDVRGKLYLDHEDPATSSCFGEIDPTKLYVGEPRFNTQVRTADFFNVEDHPRITFAGRPAERIDENNFRAEVHLTLRGATHVLLMDVAYVGPWSAPIARNGESRGIVTRVGLKADGLITREEIGAPDRLADGRTIVAEAIKISLNIEAILDADLERIEAT